MQILICILIAFVVLCIMIHLNKRTAAKLYYDLVNFDESEKEKSPYGFVRTCGGSKWGYCITKDGEILFDYNEKSEMYYSLPKLIKEINVLERAEGYKLTRV